DDRVRFTNRTSKVEGIVLVEPEAKQTALWRLVREGSNSDLVVLADSDPSSEGNWATLYFATEDEARSFKAWLVGHGQNPPRRLKNTNLEISEDDGHRPLTRPDISLLRVLPDYDFGGDVPTPCRQ